MALTQESILSFLLEHGGKVKNSDFLSHFRSRINSNDPAEKQHNRDLFKKLVNSVAVVKTMDETKFVVVKKRYLDFIKDAPRCASPKVWIDDSITSQNTTSFSYVSPLRSQSVKAMYSDMENNNACVLNLNGNCVNDKAPEDIAPNECVLPNNVDATTVRVLNIPGHQATRVRKTGSVFALVAVRSPPKTFKDELHPKTTEESILVTKVSQTKLLPSAYLPTNKSDAALGDMDNRQADDVVQPIAVPPVRPPQSKNSKQGEETKYSESVPLDPLTHEWLVKCAAGLWGQVYALLLHDIHLIQRKDFMSGFTVLHWAAKDGNCDMMRKIMGIAKKRCAFINVNVKAHGGYTPLHIAAIHGHTKVLFLLVQGYGANVNLRDNDGKKASHYLGSNVLAEVKVLLGTQLHSKYGEKKEKELYKQSRNMSTISKCFHPNKGKKHRVTKTYAQDW
ncbi:hypothetical protein NL108_014894 [Boleophthalmus pectinirostris]|uniref:ankyrin repeat domain-containing protein SOWAHC n=1 Tax=Boleophthalmus pectinirostris TaxID=150288 RepID=UPI00243204ED|nr:ankyrin repeat domain-containing protein SOWAHC [Boleophthalmus pectinirostris]KAJ0050283.1 hypothetical protein NL108_014894 [Boleophthalmus pectinirostris]